MRIIKNTFCSGRAALTFWYGVYCNGSQGLDGNLEIPPKNLPNKTVTQAFLLLYCSRIGLYFLSSDEPLAMHTSMCYAKLHVFLLKQMAETREFGSTTGIVVAQGIARVVI